MRVVCLVAVLTISCSHPDHLGAPADGPTPSDAMADAAAMHDALPPFVSTIASCTMATGPCATADLSGFGHVISPAIFGDGMEWDQNGQEVLIPDASGQTAGTLRTDVMTALGATKLTVMRYPGGTLADMFHWAQAVGPVASRVAQPTFDSTELPLFGPDEFAAFAHQLGVDILLTVNVATGTADEAAQWIAHWKAMGVAVKYAEIGNETYISGPTFPALDPVTYAQRFDAFAAAIRAVDPAIQIGMIGTIDTSSWCYPTCTAPAPWNQLVLQHATQKADFFSVHNGYSPGTDQDGASIYQAMMLYPSFIRLDDSLIEADIDLFGNVQTKGIPVATTELGSYFLSTSGATLDTIRTQIGRNQDFGAAAYTAQVLQGLIDDPRTTIANHINPVSYIWQAPVTIADPTGVADLSMFDPEPTVSAYGLVFAAYRELAAATDVPVTITGASVLSTAGVGFVPPLSNVPSLDAIAAHTGPDGWLFAINRDLANDQALAIVLQNVPPLATAIEIDVLSADALAKNLPATAPTVAWTRLIEGALPADHSELGTTVTVPKGSLIRIRVR